MWPWTKILKSICISNRTKESYKSCFYLSLVLLIIVFLVLVFKSNYPYLSRFWPTYTNTTKVPHVLKLCQFTTPYIFVWFFITFKKKSFFLKKEYRKSQKIPKNSIKPPSCAYRLKILLGLLVQSSIPKDLFIKNWTRTAVTLVLFWFDCL